MQITETLSEGLKRELKVVVAANELDERMNAKLDELKDKVRLKGFRPGKVPVAHIRKVYGQSVMAEVLQEAVEESRVKAFSERDERPAIQPNISLLDDESAVERAMQGGHDLEFTMSFEVLPKIELADLKKIEVERPVAEVAEEAVDNALKRLLEANKVYEPKDGAAEEGDRVTLNFSGKVDGVAFEGGTAEGAQVVLGEGRFIPGFEDGLVGAKPGENRTINVTFPHNYQAQQLAGKDAEFEATVTEVAAPRLPEADDEFAKGVGLESLSKLRDALKERIEKEYARISRTKAKRSLFDALDKAHIFELPPTLVEKEFEAIWQQMTTQMQRAKRTFEDEGTTEEKSREEYRAMAERRVRLGLVISEIGQRNEINVSDEELRRAIMQRAQQYPGQERQVIEFFKENPNALLEMRMPLFEEKVVDFTLELADVSEKKVSPDELFEPDEEDFVPMHDDDHDHVHDHDCGPDCGHDHDHDHDHHHDHAHGHEGHGDEQASEHKDK